MTAPPPHVRAAGSGPGVVCLHANASTSSQWRELTDLLSPKYLVLAPDSYGAGKSPDWPSDHEIGLRDEVDFLEPVFEQAGTPFTLVGHSYGAAIALIAALLHPERVRALVLYEPTLFAVVYEKNKSFEGIEGIRDAVLAAGAALDAGDKNAAARHFIDYWMGAGSWDATPPQRQPAIAASMVNVRRWGHALYTEPTPLDVFAKLDMPILYMIGEASPASAHTVAQTLLPVLPNVEVVRFPGLGHMAPVTHPQIINTAIKNFLEGRHTLDRNS